MKKLLSRLPKKALVIVAVTAAVLGSVGVAKAWYPDRPTFTVNNPAPYVTFDSITDNPNYGDERTFFDAKNATDTSAGGYTDTTNVTDGEDVLLRIYVHNDAASNLNTVPDGKGGYKGVATGASVRVALPTATDTALRANAYIDAANANPGEVSDSVNFAGSTPFQLSYEPGTATMYTNADPTGFKLNDSVVTTGAPIGYQGPDGVIPGCFQYTGIITMKVKVKTASFSVSKQVAHIGDKSYSKSITANPGETVSYELGFNNTGSQTLNDVVLRDKLPSNVNMVSKSSVLTNGSHPSGVNLQSDDLTSSNGVNIGDYAAKSNAYLQFKATMPTEDELQCGNNNIVNTVEAWVGNQEETDTATVTVNKTCATQPMYTCDLFHVTPGDRTVTVDKFNNTATNGATFSNVVINWGDNTTPLTTNNAVGQTHTYANYGTYALSAVAHFSVNGKDVTASSANCAQTVTFTAPGTPTTPTTPTSLVNTGAGNVVGIFAAVAAVGAIAHRLFLGRRLSRDS